MRLKFEIGHFKDNLLRPSHFTDGLTEIQRVKATCPQSCSKKTQDPSVVFLLNSLANERNNIRFPQTYQLSSLYQPRRDKTF